MNAFVRLRAFFEHALATFEERLDALDDASHAPSAVELAQARAEFERQAFRAGTRPWNYSRPTARKQDVTLEYMIDRYGVQGTAQRLRHAARARKRR